MEKLSERMMKLLLDEDKELQKELKQRDSMFILLENMVGVRWGFVGVMTAGQLVSS